MRRIRDYALEARATEVLRMMDERSYCRVLEGFQERNCTQLCESLGALRKPEHSDVVLICGDQEFYAHKLVLQASSPYFQTMFKSGLEESQSGRVVFKDIAPEALEAILDFIYVGSVDKIQTEDQVKRVLSAAHMMGLDDLFHYCCSSLGELLTVDNLAEVKEIGKKYSNKDLQEKVASFSNAAKIATNKYFLLSVSAAKKLVDVFHRKMILAILLIACLAFGHVIRDNMKVQKSTFFEDLLICVNSKPKDQYECFNALSKASSTGAITRLDGNALMHFALEKYDAPLDSQSDSPAFSWKLSYYSDRRSTEFLDRKTSHSWPSHEREATSNKQQRKSRASRTDHFLTWLWPWSQPVSESRSESKSQSRSWSWSWPWSQSQRPSRSRSRSCSGSWSQSWSWPWSRSQSCSMSFRDGEISMTIS